MLKKTHVACVIMIKEAKETCAAKLQQGEALLRKMQGTCTLTLKEAQEKVGSILKRVKKHASGR